MPWVAASFLFLASPTTLRPNRAWMRLSYLLCLPRKPPHVNTHCRYYAGRDQDLNTSRTPQHPVILHSSPVTNLHPQPNFILQRDERTNGAVRGGVRDCAPKRQRSVCSREATILVSGWEARAQNLVLKTSFWMSRRGMSLKIAFYARVVKALMTPTRLPNTLPQHQAEGWLVREWIGRDRKSVV